MYYLIFPNEFTKIHEYKTLYTTVFFILFHIRFHNKHKKTKNRTMAILSDILLQKCIYISTQVTTFIFRNIVDGKINKSKILS